MRSATVLHLTLNRKSVHSVYCNIGCSINKDLISSTIKNSLEDMIKYGNVLPEDQQFDSFYLYNYVVTFWDFADYGRGKITHEELMSRYIYDPAYLK